MELALLTWPIILKRDYFKPLKQSNARKTIAAYISNKCEKKNLFNNIIFVNFINANLLVINCMAKVLLGNSAYYFCNYNVFKVKC